MKFTFGANLVSVWDNRRKSRRLAQIPEQMAQDLTTLETDFIEFDPQAQVVRVLPKATVALKTHFSRKPR